MLFDADFTITIDGKGVPTASDLEIINPATARPFARAPRADAADLEAAVLAATRILWRRVNLCDLPIEGNRFRRRDNTKFAG